MQQVASAEDTVVWLLLPCALVILAFSHTVDTTGC